jgi:polyribonucleotide nucleotidyltransferase
MVRAFYFFMENVKKYEMEWAGRPLVIETGKLANQANGSCLVRYGETVVLATAVINKELREGMDFFPLMVDYEEKMYAAGKIKGSRFIKRETRPTDEAVLTARLIDRGLRPLFDDRLRNDIQVIVTVLATDTENDPDIPSILGAAVALHISDIPWAGPLVGIRIGQIEGEWVINPTYAAREKSAFDLTVCFHDDKVINIEAGANEVDEKTLFEAFKFSQKHVKKVLDFIEEIKKDVGKEKLVMPVIETVEEPELDKNQKASQQELENLIDEAKKFALEKLDKYLFNIPRGSKRERKEIVGQLKTEVIEFLQSKNIGKDRLKKAMEFFNDMIETEVSRAIIEDDKRVDGRALDEIRTLTAEVGLFARTHGSALFNRGETQVLSFVTLGAPSAEQLMDGMEISGKKRFMHHYNFPPYSVGEAKPLRGAGRREVGHGSLAEKAIMPVLPDKELFPYTIRVVSEVMSSNGSSSMASTCGASLSLFDAGVPIKRAVAGIAMGLSSDKKGNYKILTDLQDLEDGEGGMDFKVAGTTEGVTAIQMDTKTDGLSMEIVEKTLERAKQARLQILEVMNKAIPEPRHEMSKYAPRVISFRINPEKIRDVIGPGGKIINKIIEQTGVTIDIEDDGLVYITSVSEKGSAEAIQMIKDLTAEAEVGKTYVGKVVKIMDFGAFVEILPGQDGMVHVSEITDKERVNDVNKYLKVGQEVKVKVMKIDEQGRVNLSIKKAD